MSEGLFVSEREHGILLEQLLEIIVLHMSNLLHDDLVSRIIYVDEFRLLIELILLFLIIIVPILANILGLKDGLRPCWWHLSPGTFPLSLDENGSVDLIPIEILESLLLFRI